MSRPQIIDGPGLYRTRNGKKVRIFEIKTCGKSSWPAHGYLQTRTRSGKLREEWSIWALSGLYTGPESHPLDIVGPAS